MSLSEKELGKAYPKGKGPMIMISQKKKIIKQNKIKSQFVDETMTINFSFYDYDFPTQRKK